MIQVLIADDEPLARKELVELLGREKDFRVVQTAQNGKEALEIISKISVDVIFLDIEMPVLNGLEAASRIISKVKHPPLIVFATAFHQYAIDAFESSAVDYILKPVDPSRLKKTLERVRERLKASHSQKDRFNALEDELIQKGVLKKMVGHKRNSKDRIVIDPAEVFYFDTHLTEVRAHLESGEMILNLTLKELLAALDPEHFVQTHKSYIINVDKVEKVCPMFSGNFEITLKLSSLPKIPLSRRFAASLKSRLGNW